ncbi:NADAR family protein [Bdellovibrio sp. 22V]|uniref:NADAR family protein n=1 Tax=Bdellovibrio sp. 22V TaxID=3044166 RepID=UPI00254386BD|nr:NADAR family protein [Bdellovibrio sp. 22V]WII71771.1 NADAR family protein [Bdellovibrio sp. 22V]
MMNFSVRCRYLNLIFFLALAVSCTHRKVSHYDSFPRTASTPYTEDVLDFYSTKQAYGEFSNFALFPVFVDGQWWPTSEHYYQAHKYEDAKLIAWVQEAPTPMEAANRGRDKSIPKRADWEQRKDEFMEKAVWDKFTRYPELTTLLLSTGDARLYEHTKNDCYWGDCGDRTGKNKLGLLLEKIRGSLKKKP